MKSKCCGTRIEGNDKNCNEWPWCPGCNPEAILPCDLQPEEPQSKWDELQEQVREQHYASKQVDKPTEHAGRWPVHLDRDVVGNVVCEGCNTSAKKWCDAADYMRELEAERDSQELVALKQSGLCEIYYEQLCSSNRRVAALKAELAARDNEIEMRAKLFHEDMERLKAEDRSCAAAGQTMLHLTEEISALKAENAFLSKDSERNRELFRGAVDAGLVWKEECERLKTDLEVYKVSSRLNYDALTLTAKECEKVRAREVELIAYVIAKNWGMKPSADHVKEVIAEYEESKK